MSPRPIGVRLVTADDHIGLQLTLRAVLPAAAWQRCLTHFVGEAVNAVPPSARPFVVATFRCVFTQKHREAARRAIDRISRRLCRRNPRLTQLLRQADPAGLTYYSFPVEHRRQIWSTNAGDLAALKFVQLDDYVVTRLRGFLRKRHGQFLKPGQFRQWTRVWFEGHGLYRLRGTIRYPGIA